MAEYNVHISTAEEFLALPTWGGALTLPAAERTEAIWASAENKVNVYFDNDIDLKDVDLENWQWSGTYSVIDGQNHKIKNIHCLNHAKHGFIYFNINYEFGENQSYPVMKNLFFTDVDYHSSTSEQYGSGTGYSMSAFFIVNQSKNRDYGNNMDIFKNVHIMGNLSFNDSEQCTIILILNNRSYFSVMLRECSFSGNITFFGNSDNILYFLNTPGWGIGGMLINSYINAKIYCNNSSFYLIMDSTRSGMFSSFFIGELHSVSTILIPINGSIEKSYVYVVNPAEWQESSTATFPISIGAANKDVYYVQDDGYDLFTNIKTMTTEQISDASYLRSLGWPI